MAGIATLMATEMITATPNETVASVARRMSSNKVGAVLVTEGESMRGLFSERDLMTRVTAEGRDPQTTRVSEVATRELVTIEADAPLKAVLALFRDKRFRHLPVVGGDHLCGIVSIGDVVKHRLDEMELEANILRETLIATR